MKVKKKIKKEDSVAFAKISGKQWKSVLLHGIRDEVLTLADQCENSDDFHIALNNRLKELDSKR